MKSPVGAAGGRSLFDFGQRTVRTGDPWGSLSALWSVSEGNDGGALRNSWRAFAIASDQTIRNLVQVYFEIVYPMYVY